MARVGAIDVGTNSTRLLIAEITDGHLRELRRELHVTRLGDGVDARGTLATSAIDRVLAVLARYQQIAASEGATRVRAIATSAVRDAANGTAFLERVRQTTGFEAALLSGDQEAIMTVAGVLSGRPGQRGRLLVVDVGGGSTEIALVEDGALLRSVSLPAGCVRATERWLAPGPISADAVARARAELRELIARDAHGLHGDHVVAVAGTAITAAAIDLGITGDDDRPTDRHVVSADLIERLVMTLSPLPLEERQRVLGLAPVRAPVIVGGLIVLAEVLRHVGATSFTVSVRDILHGTALALARPVP